jgi:ABC-type transport system involved in Fe-S cluster assembly fused permease/ATPase subunit
VHIQMVVSSIVGVPGFSAMNLLSFAFKKTKKTNGYEQRFFLGDTPIEWTNG